MDPDPVGWLYGLQTFGIKLGLDSIRALLDLLGHPEAKFPSALVAGTNGKGSVSAMLDAILREAGVPAGLFTSPHLVRPNERIRIAGEDISTPDLRRHLLAVREAVDRGLAGGRLEAHPSFFEVMTAAALAAFREARVEAAVLEVGLGGRLDATNAVDGVVSVVVGVDLDHTERLGTTLDRIAAEKAAIVRPGRPLVSGVEQPEAAKVVRRACEEAGAPLLDARRLARVRPGSETGLITLETLGATYSDVPPNLEGAHQIENARVAVVAAEALFGVLGRALDAGAVRRGLASVRWAGRLQWIPGEPDLLLDGAHNPAGAEALAAYLRGRGGARPILLFGVMKDKDAVGLLTPLRGLVGAILLTRPPVERSADPDSLAPAASSLGVPVDVEPDPALALDRARALAGRDGFVVVAGSLYLVGEVLGLLEGGKVPGPVAM